MSTMAVHKLLIKAITKKLLGLIYTIAVALYLQFSLVEVCFLQRVHCIGNGNKIAEPSNIATNQS